MRMEKGYIGIHMENHAHFCTQKIQSKQKIDLNVKGTQGKFQKVTKENIFMTAGTEIFLKQRRRKEKD